jgi:bile acid-coenzyme A ligase
MVTYLPLGAIPTYHAQRDPRRLFVSHGDQHVSRELFDARANRRARMLALAGIGIDDRVMMIMPNCVEVFEWSFALWKVGAIPVPISSTSTEAEQGQSFDLVEPKAVIGMTATGGGAIGLPYDAPIDESLSPEPLPEIRGSHWRISMSGGSTGRPKVIVDHTPPLADPDNGVLEQRLDGVHLNTGPLYHSGPYGLSHRGLFVGSHLVTMERFDPVETLRLVERHKVDWLYMVPTMMNRIWRLPAEDRERFDLSSLRTVFHMASACPEWLKQAWIDWLGPEKIWELYSGAENPGRTVINGVEWLEHRGSVGKVQPGSELAIFDEDGRSCAPFEVGEIYFRTDGGPDAAFHYIGAEAKTRGDWQSLGDIGHLDEDGYLYVSDRRTDMIVSGGVNIYPAEIESALEGHAAVECCVVIGLPDADLGNRVHAIVQLPAEAQERVSEDELRAYLAKQLIRYKIPRSFEFVEGPLRDSAGKVRRAALRDARMEREADASLLEPTTR